MCNLYKVLIVEDNDIIREDIEHLIDWTKHGYKLVTGAKNGEEGLAMFHRYNPDIVITDIKMPVMSGLEMIDQIRKTGSHAQFILLTAYEEFEYAKKALYLDVHSYVLKHEVDDEILLCELEKQKAALNKERNMGRITKSMSLKEYLTRGDIVSQGVDNFFRWHGRSIVMVVELGEIPGNGLTAYKRLKETTEDMLSEYEFESVDIGAREYVIFLKVPESLSEARSRDFVRAFVKKQQDAFSKILEVNTAVGIGPYIFHTDKILDGYKVAKKILRQKVFYKGDCVLDIQDIPPGHGKAEEVRELIKATKQNISGMNREVLHKQLLALFTDLLVQYKSVELLDECVHELIYTLANVNNQNGLESLHDRLDNIILCSRSGNVYELVELYNEAIGKLEAALMPQYSKKIRDIIKYIHEHYQEEVNLSDLSRKLDISVIYISQLFKREVGMNFSSYLTKVRMDKAVELLETGNYKVYEVSEMVGYQTIQYFSKMFKKETGKMPSDFGRSIWRSKDEKRNVL
ncbi:response regulator transcription factor [Ruminiclostridium cellobioparum]|uniref:Stage 0 sporulation protein A homolog n=1 Tax=Ruminiclostridium cellobioparum subsp. termitidis CT1112 TaxID=1195236 RepID=S0FGE4_RUMCE|nr:response regulator [Ruminiclostridium cellobioparum]EMS70072.1 two component transcriptional regulator, AraC family protein [Ruminiclostridium cellobioparum subsp. termitidis CT1112]